MSRQVTEADKLKLYNLARDTSGLRALQDRANTPIVRESTNAPFCQMSLERHSVPFTPQLTAVPLSISNEPDVKYTRHFESYLQVTSNDRNIVTHPSPSDYRITFEPIRNVVEVELVSVILPNQNNILDEPYLVLEIEQLKSNIEFSNGNVNNAFAILPIKGPTKSPGGFIIPELGQNYRTPLKFRAPIASLRTFNIKLKDMDGNLFSFGSDTDPPTKALQNTLVFKFIKMDVDVEPAMQTRALF